MDKLRFEVGKYYRHSGGRYIHIVGAVPTTQYNWTLVAEEYGYGNLLPIGQGTGHAINWAEITEQEWFSNFSVS